MSDVTSMLLRDAAASLDATARTTVGQSTPAEAAVLWLGKTRHFCSQPQSSPAKIGRHAAIGISIGSRLFKSRSNRP
jgi:hypothetical protein